MSAHKSHSHHGHDHHGHDHSHAEPKINLNTQADGALIFTDAAAAKVKSLIDEEQNPNLSLRVFITGGGCSGFQYGFTFDENISDEDKVVEKTVMDQTQQAAIIKLVVDPFSYQYLRGAEIDYREDVNGSQFIIRNPNAKTTCGCGSSFSAD